MKKNDGRILKLIKLLGKSCDAIQVSEEMAQKFGISILYLQQRFKKETGKTILQVDHDLRLEEAKRLLETTYKSVKEICYEVGFKNYENFLRDFKKRYGISPKEAQKESWIAQAEEET